MPLSPKAQAFLEISATQPKQHDVGPVEARAQREAAPMAPGPEIAEVRDEHVPGRGGPVMVRVYNPRPQSDEGLPCLIWIHGGGWVIGSVPSNDSTCRSLAAASGGVVVSVEYRLAPEAKYPGPLEDCEDVVRWCAVNADSLGVDAGRIAVGGASAGGNLATAVALKFRDTGGPKIAHQVLVVPVVDKAPLTPSYKEFNDGFGLTAKLMDWYWGHYLRTEADADDPYVSPLRAPSLAGLPPATVITAEYDPLRDEGAAYAERLQKEGVPVTYRCFEGMVHIFFNSGAPLEETGAAIELAASAVRSMV